MRGSKQYWLGFAFTHLAELIRGDMSLHTAFRTVAENIHQSALKKSFHRIADRLENGETLTDIPLFIQMLPRGSAGIFSLAREKSDMAVCFENIAGASMGLSTGEELPDKPLFGPISALMITLTFIFVMGASVGTATITFGRIFGSLGARLPALTRICLFLGQILARWWPLMILITLLAGLSALFLGKARNRTIFPAWLNWHMPMMGRFDRMEFMIAVTQYLALGIRIKLPLHTIFQKFSEECGNALWRKITHQLAHRLAQGDDFMDAADAAGFPNPDYHFYFQAVSDGDTLESLRHAQEELFREMDQLYRVLTRRFHLFYFFGTGIIVGLFVIAMYLPMFALIGELSK